MVDDRYAWIRSAFICSKLVAAVVRRPLVPSDRGQVRDRAEVDEVVFEGVRVHDRQPCGRGSEPDGQLLLVGRKLQRVGQRQAEHVRVGLGLQVDHAQPVRRSTTDIRGLAIPDDELVRAGHRHRPDHGAGARIQRDDLAGRVA